MASHSSSSSSLDDLLYWSGNEQPPSDFDEECLEQEAAEDDSKAGIIDKGKGTGRVSMYVRLFEGKSIRII
jgi:hypothetical protein